MVSAHWARLVVTLALGVAASCSIEDHLVPCGDQLCPAGTSCVGARCVSADQLAACTGTIDGDACTIDGAVGRCGGGICDAVGCGNLRVDADERCDDGNTDYGDGCAGDCRSDEQCGNGVVDFAVGESCDCGGDPATQPERCRLTNSDALEAECSTTCESRFCGDAELNTLEQCDGIQSAGATCQDFGFYEGDLACGQLCRYDLASCTGRCGDATIDQAFGEYCDSSPPFGTCVTFGYDAGTLTCSTACSPATDGCEQFGWTALDNAAPVSFAAGNDIVLVIASDNRAFVVINGIRDYAPSATYRVAAGAPELIAFAVGDTGMAVWAGNDWATAPVGWSSGTPTAAWHSPGLGLYVVVGGALWRYAAGIWSNQGLSSITGVTGDATTVFAFGATSLQRSTGATWSAVTLPSLGAATVKGFAAANGTWWLGTTAPAVYGTSTNDLAGAAPQTVEPFTAMAASPSGDVVLAPVMRRLFADGTASDGLVVPGPVQLVAFASDTGLVASGTSGTYRLRTGDWGSEMYINDLDFLADASESHTTAWDSRQILGGSTCWYAPPGSSAWERPYTAPYNSEDCVETFDRKMAYVTTEFDVLGEQGVWIVPFDDPSPIKVLGGLYRSFEPTFDGEILITGMEVIGRGGVPTSDDWSSIPVTGYDVVEIAKLSTQALVASARRLSDNKYMLLSIEVDGTVTEMPGTDAEAWRALWIAPDDAIYAVGGTTLLVLAGGQASTTSFPAALLVSVDGSSRDDVFVAGIRPQVGVFTGLSHWNGVEWTTVRLSDALTPYFLDVSTSRVHYTSRRLTYTLPRIVLW